MPQPQQNTTIAQGDLQAAIAHASLRSASSPSTATATSGARQRNPGGLIASLRRMFGSKRSRSSLSEPKRSYQSSRPRPNLTDVRISAPVYGSANARIANEADYRPHEQGPASATVERPADQRATHQSSHRANSINHASPLGSHHPSQAASSLTPRSNEPKSPKSPPRRRSTTLPAPILSQQEAQILAGPQDDLSPRVWYRPEHSSESQLRRRSRSAGVLYAGYGQDQVLLQDRASQIEYWRRSILQNPVPVWAEQVVVERATGRPNGGEKLEPMQSFDFGLTQPESEPVELEDRVNTLEVKLFDFEYAIAKLQGHEIAKPVLYSKPAKRRPSANEMVVGNETKSAQTSLPPGGGLEPTSFLLPASDTVDVWEEHLSRRQSVGSSQGTTVRPQTSRRRSSHRSKGQSPSPGLLSSERLEALMELIKEEQAARKQLELKVADLRRDVDILMTPVFAEIRPIDYPPSGPGSRQEATMAPRSLHRSPRFEYEKQVQEEISRFSVSEVDTDPDAGFHVGFENTQGPPLVGVS
ncbi:hypothetical protein DV735_g5145, partial [Chaetothyriales sp. CBS 134920]